MIIHCTKKLLDVLKLKPDAQAEEKNPLFSWHANLITVNRKKTLVLVNDQNRYVIALYGLKAKDFKNLDALIFQAIYQTFQHEGITEGVINKYLQHSTEMVYTKTKNRTLVSRLNKGCEMISYFSDDLEKDFLIQSRISRRVSQLFVGTSKGDYSKPNEALYNDLEAFSGQPTFQCEAVELLVTLNLKNHRVWRRLIVPTKKTFRQLHQIIQIAFGWHNSHLYEFNICDPQKEEDQISPQHPNFHKNGHKLVLKIVCDPEMYTNQKSIPKMLDHEVRVSQALTDEISYIYDLGDGWHHDHEIVNIIPNYDKNHPICLEGEGNRPPEDVGGEQGYEEFLTIIQNPKHPDYKFMKSWYETQRGAQFQLTMINAELKRME